MAQVIGCPVSRNELLNELGCGGGATLFVDNIDQIDDAEAWLTLRDLLRGVLECAGWRAVFTVRSDGQEWRANLPDEMRQLPFAHACASIRCRTRKRTCCATDNPALSALLAAGHPARAMARNLFYLSRLVDLAPPARRLTLANEIDLARTWWRFGGGRSETGKFERLKLLRSLGERSFASPGLRSSPPTSWSRRRSKNFCMLKACARTGAGATVAFWHDTLRDWTVGFLLDERPELRGRASDDRPMPGALARGLEIAARLALESDATGRPVAVAARRI